jgi:lipopolysaccharide biosynthesis glycosyltransferase
MAANTSRKLRVHLFCKDFSAFDAYRLTKTLSLYSTHCELVMHSLDERMFRGLPRLHGSSMIYWRLLIPQALPCDRLIYLDSDTIVALDVAQLFEEPLDDYTIGVSGVGSVGTALDCAYFQSLGMDRNAPYFNSGVLLIDCLRWRHENVSDRCLALAHEHRDYIKSHDQSVLNMVFHQQFKILPKFYNLQLEPRSRPINSTYNGAILHFVGSPKPWDLGGEFVHSNYSIFSNYLKQTELRRFKSYRKVSWRSLKRALRLSRSYWRAFFGRRPIKKCPRPHA